MGDGVGEGGNAPGIEAGGLAKGAAEGVTGCFRDGSRFSGVVVGVPSGGGGEGGGAGIDVPDVSDSDSDGGSAGRLKRDGSAFSCLGDDLLMFDIIQLFTR